MRLGLLLLVVAGVGGWALSTTTSPNTPDPAMAQLRKDPASEPPHAAATLAGRPASSAGLGAPTLTDLLASLSAKDKISRMRGERVLRDALLGGTLPSGQVLDLFLSTKGVSYQVRNLLRAHFVALGSRAGPLMPRLMQRIEDGATTKDAMSSARLAASLLPALANAKTPEQAQSVLRPFLARAITLLENADADEDLRRELLVFPMRLGAEASRLAPALVAWIQAIDKYQQDYQEANPGVCVDWDATEYYVQDALSKLGSDALSPIISALENTPRYGAYTLRTAIEEMEAGALPALHDLLSHTEERIASAALVAIGKLRKGTPELLVVLRDVANDPRPHMRASAMTHFGRQGANAVPDLVAGLADANRSVRNASLKALNKNPDALSAAVPDLLALLREGRATVPVDVLAKIGPAAAEAAPYVFDKLVAILGNKYIRRSRGFDLGGYMGISEVEALSAFGPSATRYLVEQATRDDVKRRGAALLALQHFKSVNPRDVAPLAQHIGDWKGLARVQAAEILIHHAGSIATLREGLRSDDRQIRVASARGLQESGPAGLVAWSELVEGLRRYGELSDAEDADFEVEFDLLTYSITLTALAAHDPIRVVSLLRDPSDAVADAGTDFLAQEKEDGLAMAQKHFADFSDAGRLRVARSFAHRAYHRKSPFLAARPWVLSLLKHRDPQIRLAAAAISSGDEPDVGQIAVLVELLTNMELAQCVSNHLRSYGAKLAPYEAQLRAVQPKEKGATRRWIQDVLDAIEVSRPR